MAFEHFIYFPLDLCMTGSLCSLCSRVIILFCWPLFQVGSPTLIQLFFILLPCLYGLKLSTWNYLLFVLNVYFTGLLSVNHCNGNPQGQELFQTCSLYSCTWYIVGTHLIFTNDQIMEWIRNNRQYRNRFMNPDFDLVLSSDFAISPWENFLFVKWKY